jgi:hypothetical protein
VTELAYHYVRSANTLKTVDYLTRAAHWAYNRSADKEADAHLKSAIPQPSLAFGAIVMPEPPMRSLSRFGHTVLRKRRLLIIFSYCTVFHRRDAECSAAKRFE